MEEYNINNNQKMDSINFMNINNEKISSQIKDPLYQLNQINTHLIPLPNEFEGSMGLDQKGKFSQKNFTKIKPINTKFITNSRNSETPVLFRKTVGGYLEKLEKSKGQVSLNHRKNQNFNNSKQNISNNSLDNQNRFNNRLFNQYSNNEKIRQKKMIINTLNSSNNFIKNNNTYIKGNYNYKNKSSENNEMMLKNKNIIYEKEINELKKQNNNLMNRLKYYLNEIKKLEIKNKNYQIEVNHSQNIYNENNNNNLINNRKELTYRPLNSNLRKIDRNNNYFNSFNKTNEVPKDNYKENISYNKNVNTQTSSQKNLKIQENQNLQKILEQKDNEIKILYQQIQKYKKEIELMTLKNSNLSKLLTKKNIDLIGYQKNEIDKEKKIEQLTSLLFQQSISNKSLSYKKDFLQNLNLKEKKSNDLIDTNSEDNKLTKRIASLNNEIKSKNSLINDLNKENNEKTKQIEDLSKKINDLEIDIKGFKYEERQNFFEKKQKDEIISKQEKEMNDMKNKLQNLEDEKNNLINDISNKEKEFNNKELIIELNDELTKYKKIIEQKDIEIKKILNNNKQFDKDKENEKLIKKLEELSNENRNLLDQINNVTNKYHEQKNKLIETNKQLESMKEMSKNFIEIEKLKSKQNDESKIINNLNPNMYNIITNKKYKKLEWYLLFKKSDMNSNNNEDENNYDNYIWVSNSILKNEDLNKYNEFEDENNKNKELKDYIFELQKKLEKKEESISKLDFQNKKLASQLLNKTENMKGKFVLQKSSKPDNYANSFNEVDNTAENEIKYKNILEKLNQSNQREKHLYNQITLLKEKINEQNNLENTFPHDMKNIDPHLQDSGFLDDDSEDNKNQEIKEFCSGKVQPMNNNINTNEKENINNNMNNKDINDENVNNNEVINNDNIEKMDIHENINNDEEYKKSRISSKNDPFKESEKLVDEFLLKGAGDEDDYDEVKIITKQMNFLKDEIKENREKSKKLGNEIKDLFTKIKCNDKNRKNIVQICQLLGFTPELVDQIISNKKPKK